MNSGTDPEFKESPTFKMKRNIMMKKIFTMLLAASMITGCQVSDDENDSEASSGLRDGYALLNVNIGGWESEVSDS